VSKDLLIKNVDLEIGNSQGNSGGWAWFNFTGPGMRLQVDNCIMEHTWWCWVGGPPADSRIFFTNDYFINLSGHSCRRNGGVTDFNSNYALHQDTLVVENCTHVNTQGSLYRFRHGYSVNKVIFNHNDFIDCAYNVFKSYGDQANMSVTNNIFVNCQLQAFGPSPFIDDIGFVDWDAGLVNVRDDSTFQANGASFYADRNLAYWDPSLSDIVSTLNADSVNGSTEWVSQMITMNSRTADMFADSTTYPLLTNGKWYNQLPDFADTDNLFTTQLAVLKAYAIAAVDTGYGTPMPSWRQPNNPEATNFVHADFPIPIDLSYTAADLKTAGLGGFPLGDLNWFPTEYEMWTVQKADEYAYIAGVLDGSITIPPVGIQTTQQEHPRTFRLQQNYPNPFNPSTTISYTVGAIRESPVQHVELSVYNILGQKVATLVDKKQSAGPHQIEWDASGLASGIYLYRLQVNEHEISKKMVLMK